MSWLAGLVAVCVTVLGFGTALYVGPAGLVRLPAHEVDGGSPLLVTSPALLRYDGTTLRVTATPDRGPVFLGAAHPVDVASYLGPARHFRVDQVRPSGEVSGGSSGDAVTKVPSGAQSLDIWTAKASGEGEQSIDLPLAGNPVQVLAQTMPGSTVTLGLAATVPGLFALALAVGVVGLLGLLGVLLLHRRRVARERVGEGATAESPESSDATHEPKPAAAASQSRTVESVSAVVGRRSGLVVVTGAASLVMAGCVAVPTSLPPAATPHAKAALAGAEADRMLQGYDQRNNAVIAGLSKKYDTKAWESVDTGPVLAGDRFSSALVHAGGKKLSTATITHSSTFSYAPSFTAYPLWAVTYGRSTTAPAAKDDKPGSAVHVWQRDSVTTPWKMWASTRVDGAQPSAPTEPGRGNASTAEVKTGVETARQVATYLERGTKLPFTPTRNLATFRKNLSTPGDQISSTSPSCQLWSGTSKPEESIRVVRTAHGSLTVAALACINTVYAKKGYDISWDKEYASALGVSGDRSQSLTRYYAVTVAFEKRSEGGLAGLGVSVNTVRPSDLPR